jgi:membrane-bound metal-dependent hydrolase YbcI (DUF457 family)
MFIGHFAVGLASKRLSPSTSAGALILAPLFLDLIWPLFLLAGIETVRIDPGNTAFTPLDLHDYPWSHSLVMALGWSLLVAAITVAITRNQRAAVVMAFGVFSHWVLDFVTHRPDMPLYPGSATSVGLGLWNSIVATLLIESAMFAAGIWIYTRATRARDRIGRWAFVALIVVLVVFYLGAAFGPPPPNEKTLALSAVFMWLFVPWAWWLDRHRVPANG